MTIIASCGHALAEDEGEDGMGWALVTASYGREGGPALLHGVYCTACRDRRMADGEVLRTDEEQLAWLREQSLPARG